MYLGDVDTDACFHLQLSIPCAFGMWICQVCVGEGVRGRGLSSRVVQDAITHITTTRPGMLEYSHQVFGSMYMYMYICIHVDVICDTFKYLRRPGPTQCGRSVYDSI